jgi:hypothetical protein
MIHQLTENSIAIEVPEGAFRFNVYEGLFRWTNYKHYKPDQIENDGWEMLPISESGELDWQILGRPSDLTREQCDKIMEGYEGTVHLLLLSKNVTEDKVIILIKQ